jgi:cholesterol transport system auxiliary component
MTPTRTARAALLLLAPALSGCAAVTSIQQASRTLDAYELTAPVGAPGLGRADQTLLVEQPTTSGALDTDRILVKPSAIQVQYLSDARWIDPAPELVQTLLVRTIDNTGRVAFVSGQSLGPIPDYVLLGDLRDFQVEVVPGGQPPVEVVVALALTLVRDLDQRVVATRLFRQRVPAASADAPTVVAAFDLAMDAVLAQAAEWSVTTTRATGGV